MASQTTSDLTAVAFVGDGEAYAGGNGTMLHYQRAGWIVDDTFPSADLVGVPITGLVATQGNVYAFAGSSIYVHAGGAWSKLADPTGLGYRAMWASGDEVFIVGPAGKLGHYKAGLWSETTFGTASYNAIWGTSANDVYAVGSQSSIVHFDGTTWTQVSAPLPGSANLITITGVDGDVFTSGRAGSATSVILRSTAGGPFTMMTVPTNITYALWGSNKTNVFAVGDSGGILHWDGVSWTKMQTSITTQVVAVAGSSAAEVFAVSNAGAILRFTGAGWADPVATPSHVTSKLADVWAAAPNDVVAVGAGVFRLQGQAWVDNSIDFAGGVKAVWGRGTGDIEVIGQLAAAHWNGTAWSQTMTSGIGTLAAPVDLWGSSTALYAAGAGIVEYNGSSWASIADQEVYVADWVSPSGKVWVAGTKGVGHVDGGAVTRDVAGAAFRAIWGVDDQHVFAAGSAEIRAFDGTMWQAVKLPATVGVQLDGLWGRDANDVFAVGAANTVLHYRAGLWRTISTPFTGDLVSVSGMGASIFVATTDGNVYQLIDTAP